MKQDYNENDLRSIFSDELKRFFGDKHATVDADNEYDASQDDFTAGDPNPIAYNNPIAVQIVKDKPTIVVPRGAIAWSGQTTIVNNGTNTANPGPQLIIGKNIRRRTLIVVNNGVRGIAVGTDTNVKFPTAGVYGSPLLPAGASVTLDTQEEMWAVADPVSTGEQVTVWEVLEDGQY